MMRWDDLQLVATLFHELAHQVVYVKDDTGFNESFATAVEEFGLEQWLQSRNRSDDIDTYRERRQFRQILTALVADARADLSGYFVASLGDDEKRRLKASRLAQLSEDVGAELQRTGRSPTDWLSGELNNARLVPMTLYEGRLASFRALLSQCERDIRCFYVEVEKLSMLDRLERDSRLDALSGS